MLTLTEENRLNLQRHRDKVISKTLAQQAIPIHDDLKETLLDFIKTKKLSIGDLLFSLDRDKRDEISQPNFSSKI